MVAEPLCTSLSGTYQFKGVDNLFNNQDQAYGNFKFDIARSGFRTFFNVLWGAESILDDPEEIELIHDVSANTLRMVMHGENIRNTPDNYSLIQTACIDGNVTYEYNREGYAPDGGDRYKLHYVFNLHKDAEGALIIHGQYLIKSAFLFFWSSNKWEIETKFQPVHFRSSPNFQ